MVKERKIQGLDQEEVRVAHCARQDAVRQAPGQWPEYSRLDALLAKISAEVTAEAARRRAEKLGAK